MAVAIGLARLAAPVPGSSLLRLAVLAGLVAFGVAIYGIAMQVLGVARLKDVVAALRSR